MKPEYEPLPLYNNENLRQFELVVEGYKAKITYELQRDRMSLLHTEVPPVLEGRGVGEAIVEKTLHYLEENKLKLVPWCPYVKVFLKRHPEWKRILAQGINI